MNILCLTASAPQRERFRERCKKYVARFQLSKTWKVEHRVAISSSMLANLREGVAGSDSDITAIIEDDDWYSPEYLLSLVPVMEEQHADLAGYTHTVYYHIVTRVWARLPTSNRSSLFCTILRTPLLKLLLHHPMVERQDPNIDFPIWALSVTAGLRCLLVPGRSAVGIKHGYGECLGAGHRLRPADLPKMKDIAEKGEDPDGRHLAYLIGEEDAQFYWQLVKDLQLKPPPPDRLMEEALG